MVTWNRATVQVTFLYDRSKCSRPDNWCWSELVGDIVECVTVLSDEPAPDVEEA